MSLKLFEVKGAIKTPVVIELPGLVHTGEKTRVDEILEDLAENNKIAGIRVTYDRVIYLQKDKTIVCDFDLPSALENLEEAFKFMQDEGQKYDLENISVVSSSMSAMVFAYYLASKIEQTLEKSPVKEPTQIKRQLPRIRNYASISPLPGWRNFANQETRNQIEQKRPNLPITSEHDYQNGILMRYIPKARLEKLIGIDGIARLGHERVKPYLPKMNVMTLIGKKDVRADPAAMETMHYILGGELPGITRYDSGHDIPKTQFEPKLKEFLIEECTRKTLSLTA